MQGKAKIFLVEDEMISAMFLSSQLRRMGFEVPPNASRGDTAIEAVGREQPDLILMDINLLGEMDGIIAAGKIREKKDIPVIFITGYSDNEILGRAQAQNPAGILSKPLDLKKLEKLIGSVLEGKPLPA